MIILYSPFTHKCPLIQCQKIEKEKVGAIRENSIIKYYFICVVPFAKILGDLFLEKKMQSGHSHPFHCVREGILRR